MSVFNRCHHRRVLLRTRPIRICLVTKSVSFSGARTQPSSESHGVDTALMYASPSPQLIKKESSFDLSGG